LIDGVVDLCLGPLHVDEIAPWIGTLLIATGGDLEPDVLGGLDVVPVGILDVGHALPNERSLPVGGNEGE
jgi:hypothetical protein